MPATAPASCTRECADRWAPRSLQSHATRPSFAISPQEFALGRALKQTQGRRRVVQPSAFGVPDSLTTSTASASSSTSSYAASAAPAALANGEDLTQFVAAFKEMADHLDEEGAANLLMWSPLFLPTVEGLMRQGEMRAPKPKLKGAQPKAVRHPLPHPRAAEAAAVRAGHMERMRQMYTQGGQDSAAAAEAPNHVPSPTQQPGRMQLQPTQLQPAPPLSHEGLRPPPSQVPAALDYPRRAPLDIQQAAAAPAGGGAAEDEWEEEVDDLLDWTAGLGDNLGEDLGDDSVSLSRPTQR
jgi:hypothetical protein